MKNSYDRNESMNTKVYHKKELNFFVHTEARFSYRKICPCFYGVTVFCYWYNFSNLGRRVSIIICCVHCVHVHRLVPVPYIVTLTACNNMEEFGIG